MPTAGLGPAAFLGPAGIAFSVGSAILGTVQAIKRNKALKAYADQNFRQIDQQITNARFDGIRAIAGLYRESHAKLASIMNVAPEGLSAIETIASRVIGGVASDTYAINEGVRRAEEAGQGQKANVAASARSGMTSPALEALSGAIGVAKGALDITNLLADLKSAGLTQRFHAAVNGNEAELGSLRLDLTRSQLRGQDMANDWLSGRMQRWNDEINGSSAVNDIHRIIGGLW